MVILGVDPGTATTGFGVIKMTSSGREFVACGVIKTNKAWPMPRRLAKLHKDLLELIDVYQPDAIAVEQLFFAKNVKTALSVGQARGVILLAADEAGLQFAEYTPLQVKQAVTSYGRASKGQIQAMVKTILNLAKLPQPDDAADALAIAICHSAQRLDQPKHI